MKAVFLDSGVIDPGDISWSSVEAICDFVKYDDTPEEQAHERLKDSEAVFIDSFPITGELMRSCPKLRFLGVAATGYNHIDIATAEELGIAVANVPAYSTDAVAQHAFSLLMTLANRIPDYSRMVSENRWEEAQRTGGIIYPIQLLRGKSIGIVGYGNIGRRVGEMAEAFGMTVNVYSRDREAAVSSDFVSLHCPLTDDNREMVNRDFIGSMKDGAILINTARGGLVDEAALAEALKSGKISAAGLDVLGTEPPQPDNVLLDAPNCIITPHIAFTPHETRMTVVETCAANLKSFIDGEKLNRLV